MRELDSAIDWARTEASGDKLSAWTAGAGIVTGGGDAETGMGACGVQAVRMALRMRGSTACFGTGAGERGVPTASWPCLSKEMQSRERKRGRGGTIL